MYVGCNNLTGASAPRCHNRQNADGAAARDKNAVACERTSATNSVKATVTDAQGNLLAGQVVNFSADNGATIAASGTTGADGTVTMTLTSLVAGD